MTLDNPFIQIAEQNQKILTEIAELKDMLKNNDELLRLKDVCTLGNMSAPTARKMIRHGISTGQITPQGKGRNARYLKSQILKLKR